MSKRNGRPPPKREQPPPPAHHPVIARTAKVWSVLIAIGSVGGFLSLAEKAWTVAVGQTKPDVRPLNLSADPFTLPFVIKNQSSLFTIADATWICRIDSVGNPRTGAVSDLDLIPATPSKILLPANPTDILPGRSLLARCPIGGAAGSDATIIPILRYKTFGLAREYSDSSFTWLSKANPPQWIEGMPLK